ncbi:MAG: phage tail tape measure protein, partial [Gemmatimonadales bacterium]|nr:phage tail tape measure protein [Gemmatimonadales bacterium]
MSNPSVTATINVDDKASPALKELARLAKMIGEETAKALKGGGDGLTQSLHKANAAATEHLTKLGAMRNMYKEIAAIGAGIAASKVFHAGEAAIGRYLPVEKAVRYNNAILQATPEQAR